MLTKATLIYHKHSPVININNVCGVHQHSMSEEAYLTPLESCNTLYTGGLSGASSKGILGARRVYVSQAQACLFQVSSKTLCLGTGSTAAGKANSKQPRVLKTLCPWAHLYGKPFPTASTIVYPMA